MYSEKTYDKGHEDVKELSWKQGSVSSPKINNALRMSTFTKIEKIIPQSQKTLDDARGFIISDYQVQLEQEWIVKLKMKYEIRVNNDVLRQLIK